MPLQFIGNFHSQLIDGLPILEQGRHPEVPDIDHLQAHLLEVRILFFPPLVTVMIDQFPALDPGSAVPFKILGNPVLMHTGIHIVLHGQHVGQCLLQVLTS